MIKTAYRPRSPRQQCNPTSSRQKAIHDLPAPYILVDREPCAIRVPIRRNVSFGFAVTNLCNSPVCIHLGLVGLYYKRLSATLYVDIYLNSQARVAVSGESWCQEVLRYDMLLLRRLTALSQHTGSLTQRLQYTTRTESVGCALIRMYCNSTMVF